MHSFYLLLNVIGMDIVLLTALPSIVAGIHLGIFFIVAIASASSSGDTLFITVILPSEPSLST